MGFEHNFGFELLILKLPFSIVLQLVKMSQFKLVDFLKIINVDNNSLYKICYNTRNPCSRRLIICWEFFISFDHSKDVLFFLHTLLMLWIQLLKLIGYQDTSRPYSISNFKCCWIFQHFLFDETIIQHFDDLRFCFVDFKIKIFVIPSIHKPFLRSTCKVPQ